MGLQFHADGEELINELLPRWLADVDYFYAVGRQGWSNVDRMGARGPLVVDSERIDVSQVLVRLGPFAAVEGSDLDFLRSNVGSLAVSVSHVRNGCLRESMIGSIADDPAVVAVWRRVIRRAQRELLRGAVVVGLNGDRRLKPQHRYSPGAAALYSEGVQMLAIAGGVAYELGGVALPSIGAGGSDRG
jgi:hypothetical protein